MQSRAISFGRAGLGCLLLALAGARATEQGPAAAHKVAIVRTAAWSQGDAAREGAAELMVLLEVARLRHESAQGGLVAVGDRRGLFSAGAEEALHHAVLRGVPVVKLASNGRVLPAPHGLFLDGGDLSAEEAREVLAGCLARYGAIPASGDARVTPELRARLALFQQQFTLAAGTRVALR